MPLLLLLTTVGAAARAKKPFSEAARNTAIRHAQVWTPTFSVARVERRVHQAATVEQWVEVFKQKRAEIVSARCPS